MQQATRYTFWVIAVFLLGAALVNALQQFVSTEPFAAVFPCALAMFGAGFGYLGALFGVSSDGTSCEAGSGEEQDVAVESDAA